MSFKIKRKGSVTKSDMTQHKQCIEVIRELQMKLETTERNLQAKTDQIKLLSAIIYGLKDDLNMKNEQFDYLFAHILNDNQEEGSYNSKSISSKSSLFTHGIQTQQKNINSQAASEEEKKEEICKQLVLPYQYFQKMNSNVSSIIFEFLDLKSLSYASRVCKQFRLLTMKSKYWRIIYFSRYRNYIDVSLALILFKLIL